MDYWVNSWIVNHLAKAFRGKQGFGPDEVKIVKSTAEEDWNTAEPEL